MWVFHYLVECFISVSSFLVPGQGTIPRDTLQFSLTINHNNLQPVLNKLRTLL